MYVYLLNTHSVLPPSTLFHLAHLLTLLTNFLSASIISVSVFICLGPNSTEHEQELNALDLILWAGGAVIPGARSPWPLNLVPWHLIYVGPQGGILFMSPLWRLEFSGGSYIRAFLFAG